MTESASSGTFLDGLFALPSSSGGPQAEGKLSGGIQG